MGIDERKIIEYTQGALADSELSEVNHWRKESKKNQKLYSEILALRVLNRFYIYNGSLETQKAFERLDIAIKRRARRKLLITVSKYAAILLIAVSLITYSYFKMQEDQYSTFVCDAGENVKRIELADNSIIWLHKYSELKVPNDFSKKNRNLMLNGRAFFDVAKDTIYPFLVSVGDANIKVVGTSFDLYIDDENKIIETILVSGSVVLQDINCKDILEIKPGEKVTYNTEEHKVDVELVDVNVLTAWHLDQLIFENETLGQIVSDLNLIYKVNIVITSDELADKKFRFVINKNEPIDEVLNNLSYLGSIRVIRNNDKICIEK